MTEIRREMNLFIPHDCEHGPQDLTCCGQPILKEAAQLPQPSRLIHLVVDTPELGSKTHSPEGMKPQAPRGGPRPWRRPWPRSSNPG